MCAIVMLHYARGTARELERWIMLHYARLAVPACDGRVCYSEKFADHCIL